MPSLIKTEILVKAALSGQYDKAGISKFAHCMRVGVNADKLLKTYKIKDSKTVTDVVTVALLHDVIEDSDITADDLHLFGYSNAVIDAVELVTHDETESYSDYIDRLCLSGNFVALIAKLADNLDNNSEERTKYLDESFKAYLAKRYSGVREKLQEAIKNYLAQSGTTS